MSKIDTIPMLEAHKCREDIREHVENRRSQRRHAAQKPVCLLYTGGSVGMVPKDPDDKESPLVTERLEKALPLFFLPDNLPFDIDFYQTRKILDSSNMGPKEWKEIARIIVELDPHYQGIVILHGTDTMTYTASALSFMLTNLQRPIILTGAERPLGKNLTDARGNIQNALNVAAHAYTGIARVPEVCIYFGSKLIRGNRAKKTHSLKFDGFDSPNFGLLGRIEDQAEINRNHVRDGHLTPDSPNEVVLETAMDDRVAIFEIFPGSACTEALRLLLTSDHVQGLILKTYGTGNAPNEDLAFEKAIHEAVQNRKVIVNITHCLHGKVEVRLFETNARLFELGVINGGDMTVEAAYTKLMWLMGKYGNPNRPLDEHAFGTIKRAMQVDWSGELRHSAYSLTDRDVQVRNGEPCQTRSSPMGAKWSDLDDAYVRVHGITVDGPEGTDFQLEVFFDPSPRIEDAPTQDQIRKFRVDEPVKRTWEGDPITFNIPAFLRLKPLVSNYGSARDISLQIVTDCDHLIDIDTVELAVFTQNLKGSS